MFQREYTRNRRDQDMISAFKAIFENSDCDYAEFSRRTGVHPWTISRLFSRGAYFLQEGTRQKIRAFLSSSVLPDEGTTILDDIAEPVEAKYIYTFTAVDGDGDDAYYFTMDFDELFDDKEIACWIKGYLSGNKKCRSVKLCKIVYRVDTIMFEDR